MNSKFLRLDLLDSELSGRMTERDFARMLTLRDHSRFLSGLSEYGRLIPDYFANNIHLNKVVTEAWRFEMLVYLLYLHDTARAEDPRSGLTLANLQRLCQDQQCASPGRVFAILGIMRIAGYLTSKKGAGDMRVRGLEPSEKLIKTVEGWNQNLFRIIDSILPEGQLAADHLENAHLGRVMRRRGAEALIGGWKLLAPFPEVRHFVYKDGGWMLLLTCVSQSLALGQGSRIVPVSLDLAAFGARFGVSRSHLRRLLETAYQEGLLDAPPKNGSNIELSERLVASFLACMASELGFYLEHATAARIELGLVQA